MRVLPMHDRSVFCSVAEANGLSAGAQAPGHDTGMGEPRIKALEQRLGVCV
jgi:hypothetical protein